MKTDYLSNIRSRKMTKKNILLVSGMAAVLLTFIAALAACSSKKSPEQQEVKAPAASKPGGKAKSANRAAPESDFSVKLNETGDGVVIRKYVGSGGTVVIPAIIEGIPVREIESEAFFKTTVTAVTIPDGVTSISNSAGWGCSSLVSVTIPDSVTSISNHAFCGCSSLASVTIPDSVTSIGSGAFSGCSSLASVTIPDNVTSIGMAAFSECSSLVTVTISPVKDRQWDYDYPAVFSGCPRLDLKSQAALRAAGYEGNF
jgi:hypothetical protein